MTNPLPESAVELAARAIALADDCGSDWDDTHIAAQHNYRRMARAALAAAPSGEGG